MADFWNTFLDWFKNAENSSPNQPFLHEVIVRSADQTTDYENWKRTLVKRRLLDWLHDQYSVFRIAPADIDEGIDFLNTPSSKGFVIHFNKTNYSLRDVTHLLDFFKERVLTMEYHPQLSDTRTFQRKDWVETVERYYLKPKPQWQTEGKFRQLFGNILIEMVLRDDRPWQLKLSATVYNDHKFEAADNFESLLPILLKH